MVGTLGNNRKITKARKNRQVIKTKRVFIEKYLTKTGKTALAKANDKEEEEKETVWKAYGKNRYEVINLKYITVIQHSN